MSLFKVPRAVTGGLLGSLLVFCPVLAKAETVHDMYELGDVQVPLPPGQWEVSGAGSGTNNSMTSIGQTILISVISGRLTGLISISTPVAHSALEARFSGFKQFRDCERNDVFFVFKDSNFDGGEHNCWVINHFSMGSTGNVRSPWGVTWESLKSQGVAVPINMVVVTFHVANKRKFETVMYYFNPEIEGISPPKYAEWRNSDWHKDRVNAFPDKLAYLTKTKQWAEQWHALMEKGFSLELPATDVQ